MLFRSENANFINYYSIANISLGSTFNAGLVAGTDYVGNSISYSSSSDRGRQARFPQDDTHIGLREPRAENSAHVLSYTKNVALRIAKYGAVCNSLDFGGVLTELNKPVMEDKALWDEIMEQTPLKRWMTVEETADWAYFMTVTNRFCTGQNILIDGLEAGNAHFVWPETDN